MTDTFLKFTSSRCCWAEVLILRKLNFHLDMPVLIELVVSNVCAEVFPKISVSKPKDTLDDEKDLLDNR